MDKKISGLVGALSTAAALGAVSAAPVEAAPATTPQAYADLVRPIPNALAALLADEAARPKTEAGDVQEAQYYPGYHHHHHHHRWYRRHHHHHHHRYRRHHHHHHHW